MKLTFEKNKFVWRGDFNSRHLAKNAGFRWRPDLKSWETNAYSIAQKLAQYADEKAQKELAHRAKIIEQSKSANVEDIFLMGGEIPVPPTRQYLPYQKAGIVFAAHHENCLIADEMGLGKTIQAIGLINYLRLKKVLIICPASLKENWARECEAWLAQPLSLRIAKKPEDFNAAIVIINYDILVKYKRLIDNTSFELLICDESHYLKNGQALRTKTVFGSKEQSPILAPRKLFLTGTPILNRPIELWTMLKNTKIFDNWVYYIKRYCAGYEDDYGWVTSGASNTEELGEILREKIMIRRTKTEVLTELPAKIRQIIYLEADKEVSNLVAQEKEIIKLHGADFNEESIGKMQNSVAAFSELAHVRKQTALKKCNAIPEAICDILEQKECCVVFTHHVEVAHTLSRLVGENNISCEVFSGETSLERRQQIVDDFQNGKIQVFIGTTLAAGVGITLTRASTVLFVELEWTPALIAQAEDRLHRIGQKDCVHCLYYLYDHSIDAMIAKKMVSKEKIIEEILS